MTPTAGSGTAVGADQVQVDDSAESSGPAVRRCRSSADPGGEATRDPPQKSAGAEAIPAVWPMDPGVDQEGNEADRQENRHQHRQAEHSAARVRRTWIPGRTLAPAVLIGFF